MRCLGLGSDVNSLFGMVCAPKRGYTLIELIIVMTIISILIDEYTYDTR